MTRNFQQEGYAQQVNNPIAGQSADENLHRDEYRDLYNPFNIKWKSVLGQIGSKAAEPVLKNSKGYAVSMSKEPVSSYRFNRRVANSPYPGEASDRGFNPYDTSNDNIPSRDKHAVHVGGKWTSTRPEQQESYSLSNTYRHYTTGYGPRD